MRELRSVPDWPAGGARFSNLAYDLAGDDQPGEGYLGKTGKLGIERFEPVGLQVYRTEDPEVVITEFRYEGSAGGRALSIPNIFVTRVRDGLIIESRDYADHIGATRAFGQLTALAVTLTAGGPA